MHITFKQADANALNVCKSIKNATKKNHDLTFDVVVDVNARRINSPLLS